LANVRYYRCATLADLPSSSAMDGDLYFVRENGFLYVWDAVNLVMKSVADGAATADLAAETAERIAADSSEASTRASADTTESAARIAGDAAEATARDAAIKGIGALLLSESVPEFDSITNRKFITADGQYNASNGVVKTGATSLLLAYFKGTNHTTPVSVGYRTSSDNGASWSAESLLNPYYGGPFVWNLHRMPGGTIIASGTISSGGTKGYWYSTDNGQNWTGPITLANVSFQTRGFKIGSAAYLATTGTSLLDAGQSCFLYKSIDDGVTWSLVSEIRNSGEPQLTEVGVCYLGNNRVMAVHRDNDTGTNTYVHFSEDAGVTWGAIQDYTSQLGAIALPQLLNVGGCLFLIGRQTNQFQLVMYLSYDDGVTWSSKIVLDTYATSDINGGYSSPLVLSATQILVPYYADCTVAGAPDIKTLVLNFKGAALAIGEEL